MPRTKTKKKVELQVESGENTTRGLPITVSLKLAGQDQLADTDNVLKYFRELSIDRLKIKSNAQFTFTYNGKEFYKVLTIPQVKRFIGNDTYKQILAKWVNSNLGIKN